MSDTVESLVGRVQQRVGTLPDYFLIQDWLTSGLADLGLRREWSWRRKQGEFLFNAAYSTGTVTIARGDDQAVFSGATLTQDMVGRQIRIGGNAYPIRTIIGILGSTATLDRPWGPASKSAVSYEIYTAYVTVPEDFDAFISIIDSERRFQLDFWSWTAKDLDLRDPQRAYSGNLAYKVVLKDYATNQIGVVLPAIDVYEVGRTLVAGGTYTGVSDTVFTISLASATHFDWKKGSGAYTTGVLIDTAGTPQDLSDGVQIAFDPAVTYVGGDLFTIQVRALMQPGTPRYEFWPHIKIDESRPYLYLATLPAFTDPGMIVPRYVNPQFLLEKALASCARWRHEDNKYFDLKLAMIHEARAEELAIDMEREDQGRETTDITYDGQGELPIYDSGYLASHDIGYELNLLD